MAKIFIDSGHGDHDPGAVGARSYEKNNALKLALKLRTLLVNSGHAVKMSRTSDVFLKLHERTNLANNWGADYFVSIHNNASPNKLVSGFETFIYNGAIQKETRAFQNSVHSEIIKGIGIKDRGQKRQNFAVVRLSRMPAVLIEYGFVTNYSDETMLINEVDKLAKLTANGIMKIAGGKQITINKPAKPAPPVAVKPEKKEEKPMKKNDRKVSASHKDGWEWAIKKGFLNGEYPAENLSREQFTTVLKRVYEDLGKK